MIVFDLRCLDGGEVFEGWFSSNSEYEEQSARGLVQCPFCQSARTEKAPMAPRVARGPAVEERAKAAIAELATMQARLLKDSAWVGEQFAEKARAMHSGELEARPVHGQATRDEAHALVEEGVPILPLPLPVVPPGQVN
jgi:hypothetical protein